MSPFPPTHIRCLSAKEIPTDHQRYLTVVIAKSMGIPGLRGNTREQFGKVSFYGGLASGRTTTLGQLSDHGHHGEMDHSGCYRINAAWGRFLRMVTRTT
ncbi:hypothetical protein RRG08_064603 [Elysia crispata]|uniref:Uncharacterized protein n=1 Tax=Elysia crispata TaxID=231223 RepID=A0AAE1B9R4_9GAST|nr:hypothetical protein RRG08_064603 [Elysia crispata]